MSSRLLVACAVALTGCAGADPAPPDERPSTDVGRAGVTMRLPDGWQALPPNDGNISDPLTRVAIASGPLAEPIPGCQTQITNYAPRPDGVSVVAVEWKPSADVNAPPRPPNFDTDALTLRRGVVECFEGDGGSVEFMEQDRVFGAYVLVGIRADPQLAAAARRALATLHVG